MFCLKQDLTEKSERKKNCEESGFKVKADFPKNKSLRKNVAKQLDQTPTGNS